MRSTDLPPSKLSNRLICPPSPCAPMEELLRFMDESARWPQDDDVRYERELIQRELDRRTFGKAPGGRLPFPLYDKLN